MAFINDKGQKISYQCSELISELKRDIEEFGGDTLLYVVTENKEGVVIYKDYNYIDDDKESDFKLKINEELQKITAISLLMLYEQQNEIL